MHKQGLMLRAAVGVLLLVTLGLLAAPSSPAAADDVKWPDFEKLDGKIEGFVLPLTGEPNINGGRDQAYKHFNCTYRDGGTDNWREIYLLISYFPDPNAIYEGGMVGRLERASEYGPGYTGERGLQWLEEQRAKDYFHEILVENNRTDRFSLIYQYRSDSYAIPWSGLRALPYKNNYFIVIEAEGRGWQSDGQFLAAIDMVEQYARDAIDSLTGGLTLKHYDPFRYLEAGGGYDYRPAGDLIARLTDDDGKPVKGESVVFYVEPGSTLEEVMMNGSTISWLTTDILGADPVVLGGDVTDKEGIAYLNYLWPNLIKTDEFAAALLKQRYIHDKDGKIEGDIHAVSIDTDRMKIEQRATVHVEFAAIAKIVKISGEGRSQAFKDAYMKEYPDSPTWGPGRVRVKRSVALPTFEFTPVEEGFLLMPGDIIDMDGGTEIEIVWVTGDRAIARIPDKIAFGDTEIRPPHSRMVLSTSSYDSGFMNTWDKIQGGIFGFSVGQGLDILSGVHPIATGIKKGGEFTISIYNALKEVDFTDQNLITKIRIRSIVRINTLGEEVVIQTIEGSPDVLTVKGGETTLGAGEAISLSFDGTLGETTSFDAAGDLADWAAVMAEWETSAAALASEGDAPASEADETDEGGGGTTGIIIGVVVVIVIIGALFIIIKRRR